jgi:type VI secretion system secreted protein Hcp
MAVVDYFLKLDGIDGESSDSKHKGEIDIESWSWGETQTGTHGVGGGGGAGKVAMQDFHFVMRVNKASPKLFLACATGDHIKKAVLTCRKAGKEQQEYLKITLNELHVSSYQTGGSAGSDIVPLDQISVNFATYEMEYKEQKPDGTLGGAVKAGYDVKQGKAT